MSVIVPIKKSSGWSVTLERIKNTSNYQQLSQFLELEAAEGKLIYPPKQQIFRAIEETSFEQVKVVILGQDPYHGPKQANGLSFSVNSGQALPPSLRNIYKAIEQDLSIKMPLDGDLSKWAKQGVLLLNSVLTVEAGKANSHANKGWEAITDTIISALNEAEQHIVFLLWGAYAHKKIPLISKKHTVLTAPHPSPLSAYRGFFSCKHFSNTNQILVQHDQAPIQWSLE